MSKFFTWISKLFREPAPELTAYEREVFCRVSRRIFLKHAAPYRAVRVISCTLRNSVSANVAATLAGADTDGNDDIVILGRIWIGAWGYHLCIIHAYKRHEGWEKSYRPRWYKKLNSQLTA